MTARDPAQLAVVLQALADAAACRRALVAVALVAVALAGLVRQAGGRPS